MYLVLRLYHQRNEMYENKQIFSRVLLPLNKNKIPRQLHENKELQTSSKHFRTLASPELSLSIKTMHINSVEHLVFSLIFKYQ